MGDLTRLNVWNDALRDLPNPTVAAPLDYLRRYEQYSPQTTLQNVNLSPDFPSVAQALTGLAAQGGAPAGLTNVDGVAGGRSCRSRRAAGAHGPGERRRLGHPDRRRQRRRRRHCATSTRSTPRTRPSRVDLLGNIAQAAVDKATSGTLGSPAEIAKVLGAAAHAGHLTLAFTRPDEQRLAEQLDVAQAMPPVRSDSFALTTSNVGANKIDYYLKRDVDYRVMLHPEDDLTEADAQADVAVDLDNTAPDAGLPQIVIGPFDPRFTAGQNRSFISAVLAARRSVRRPGTASPCRWGPDANAAATSTPSSRTCSRSRPR